MITISVSPTYYTLNRPALLLGSEHQLKYDFILVSTLYYKS